MAEKDEQNVSGQDIPEQTSENSHNETSEGREKKQDLEDYVLDYNEIIGIPKHASSLINEYLSNGRPSKKSSKREVYDSLETAIMRHLERRGEEALVIVHNSNSDHSEYSHTEPLSRQFNRILYKKLDEEKGFDRKEKARMLSKIVQDYAAYTSENGGFNPADFVRAAKKANTYISRNVKNHIIEEKLSFKAGLQDDRIAFYANRNIGGISALMRPKGMDESLKEIQIDNALDKIAVKHNYSIQRDENAYYPVPQRKGFLERMGDALRFAKLGYQGAYERINNVVLAVDKKSKELIPSKPIWPIRETQYTHAGL